MKAKAPQDWIRAGELLLAAFADAYARAARELNPYGEATAESLGDARLVYSGSVSEVHGVYAAALDGPLDGEDLDRVEVFFRKFERPPLYHGSEGSAPSFLDWLKRHKRLRRSSLIAVLPLSEQPFGAAEADSRPDPGDWAARFTRARTGSQNADLYASNLIHMRETRFYLAGKAAGFGFFHGGNVFLEYAPKQETPLFMAQAAQAKEFGAKLAFLPVELLPETLSGSAKFYERMIYE